ncbi:MAG: division/cell wall cluster transcriptional repressor MraZ [Bacteroidetes bacterium]|nr:MAG: division/cell wall cluster transcriptional repressor MraZ [Bacteroidota bacterium]
MAFFTSEYTCKLDAKGRLVLPAKMKANLPEAASSELFMREGFEPCLELYPLIEYKKIYSKIAGLNEFNAEYRKLQRNFFRGSTTVELDSAGRLLIPKPMLQYANLDKEIVVVGMGNRMEIWNPEEYKKFLINDPQELSELAEKHLTEHD